MPAITRRTGATLAALAITASLPLATPTAAHAATGTVTYHFPNRDPVAAQFDYGQVTNPRGWIRYNTTDAGGNLRVAEQIDNRTDKVVRAYPDRNCTSYPPTVINPGSTARGAFRCFQALG
ncbi:hypothetical protein [Actinomadura chibensis]|uniref:Secreted protein n=1 Tax=Actinomadura chibensis TaxID=392828 RepID=A0A5D0NEI0_9ACTN|nr:hypothetical protein [Actinomadura chibensis]TYB42840.1 hypothetical protein FXF69_29120 [Actinomadura chibensis]